MADVISIGQVFPAYKMVFKVGIKGLLSTDAEMVEVADVEEWTMSIDGNMVEFSPYSAQGWTRSIITGKKFSIECKGKRSVGDPGNDFIAGIAWKDGLDCSTKVEVTFPNGDKLKLNAAVDVTNPGGGGASQDLSGLEFKFAGDGKPNYEHAKTGGGETV